MKSGVMVHMEGDRATKVCDDEKEPPVVARAPLSAPDVVKQVILDQDPPRRLARIGVIGALDLDTIICVPDDVIRERHILDGGPGGGAILIAYSKHDGIACLLVCPDIFENAAVYPQA